MYVCMYVCMYMYAYDFDQFETIRYFGDNTTYTGKNTVNEAENDQSNLLEHMVEFNDKSTPRSKERKEKNKYL